MKAQCVVLTFMFFLLLSLAMSAPSHGSQTAATAWVTSGSARPAIAPDHAQPSQVPPVYDEQLGMTFAQDFSGLEYNVTAVAQSDPFGYGPAYLLNGLTDGGYWYQVGVAYDWPYQSGGYVPGFHFLYEAFNDSGGSVFPAGGGGGLGNFSGPVNGGDQVLLRLNFSGGQMDFFARDWRTGSTASESFPAVGSRFVGLRASSGANGFFTGLMTEWYHASPYYSDEGEVDYTNPSNPLQSATLWVDEFDANTSASLFGYSQSYTFADPNQLRIFSLEGATEYGDAYEFVTGATGKSVLTLSFSVSGGGDGFLPPILEYVWNGTEQTAALTQTPTSFVADNGTAWRVSATLPGSSGTERWKTQMSNGSAAGYFSEVLPYFHQYLVWFEYRSVGGGTGYGPPTVDAVEFGFAASAEGNTSAWVDAGSSFSYPSILPGSGSTERWASQGYTASVTGPAEVSLPYYHQVSLSFEYTIVGGGTPSGPTLTGTQFGVSFSTAALNSSRYFLDARTLWSTDQYLKGINPQERWVAMQPTNGTASQPESVIVAYRHQFTVVTNAIPIAGGSFSSIPAEWADAGSAVQISATPSQGWEFEGWVGSGNGSYDGGLNSRLIELEGPIMENATFFPSLTITSGEDGSVSYFWQGGSGKVAGGNTAVVYVPPGTEVTLEPAPSSFYALRTWVPGANGSSSSVSLRIESPQSVSASFSPNWDIEAGGVLAFVAFAILTLFAARRIGRERRSPAFNLASQAP